MHLHLNPWIFVPAYVVVAVGIDQLVLRRLRARRQRLGLASDDPRADDRRDWWRADAIGRLVVLAVVIVVLAIVWLLSR